MEPLKKIRTEISKKEKELTVCAIFLIEILWEMRKDEKDNVTLHFNQVWRIIW